MGILLEKLVQWQNSEGAQNLSRRGSTAPAPLSLLDAPDCNAYFVNSDDEIQRFSASNIPNSLVSNVGETKKFSDIKR